MFQKSKKKHNIIYAKETSYEYPLRPIAAAVIPVEKLAREISWQTDTK